MDAGSNHSFPILLGISYGIQESAKRSEVQLSQMVFYLKHARCILSLKRLPLDTDEGRNSRPFASLASAVNVDAVSPMAEAKKVSVHSNSCVCNGR